MPIPDGKVAAGFQDGGGPQLKAITKECSMQEDEDMRMSVNKHSASQTAAEQPADLMFTFKVFNRNQKNYFKA